MGIDTGVMREPMLRAWMMQSVLPATHHDERPGRWIVEDAWAAPSIAPRRWFLAQHGLSDSASEIPPREVCSPQDVGRAAGSWCPFGRGQDDAGDQREDDARSLTFETEPLDETIEVLGAPVVSLDIACDMAQANLAVRLCDVHPDGASLRVSFGIINLTHRDGHEAPAPLRPGERYRVTIRLNDAGFAFPPGHRIRVAISTAYWPMIWPSPEAATVTVFAGRLELPVRGRKHTDRLLSPFPPVETAAPEPRTLLRPGVVRIDRIGIELGSQGSFDFHIEGDDPLSAVAEMHQTHTVSRGDWRTRVETRTRLSCTRENFVVCGGVRAWDGDEQVCDRDWSCTIARDHV
jgi:predicted acyl esterase